MDQEIFIFCLVTHKTSVKPFKYPSPLLKCQQCCFFFFCHMAKPSVCSQRVSISSVVRQAFANTGKPGNCLVLSPLLHSIVCRTQKYVLAVCNMWKKCAFPFTTQRLHNCRILKKEKFYFLAIDVEMLCNVALFWPLLCHFNYQPLQ